jgi:hypothetical protein
VRAIRILVPGEQGAKKEKKGAIEQGQEKRREVERVVRHCL